MVGGVGGDRGCVLVCMYVCDVCVCRGGWGGGREMERASKTWERARERGRRLSE